MLCLSRKAGEKIVIGSEITVTVQKLSASRVRLGIEAPKKLHVLRGELLQRLQSELSTEEVSEL